ncbi:hypothetical protein Brsp04_01957 [Brucella sp. NBRC 12952]|uniref:Uncharacterized protein n=1 Tax=Brucella pseudogrignonensis TaxID=419475 RepID=A0A7Y3T1R7_9HYPH|nr:hypothetical protein [Brucella pseudogrignonensis]EMG52681.1 hypothetical protein WYI_16225 [Ochrobactrum sp. CDB2]NNV19464.1 hypothetical protein [Brucella pseudogrignonensis]
MQATQQVIDMDRMGKKGTLIHPEAYGEQPPMKTVPVEAGEPDNNHPGLNPVDVYRLEIQAMIDAKANERQYDSGATLASYVNSTIEQWSSEAQAFVAWRDAVWLYALAELDKVQKADRAQPSVEDLLAELPAFEWPVAQSR